MAIRKRFIAGAKCPACQAQDQGTALDVDDLGVEELGDIGQFFAGLRRRALDFDHRQFIADERRIVEVDDFDDVDELGQLVDGLVEFPAVFNGNDDVDTRYVSFFRITGIDTFNINGSAADQAGDVRQDARFIVAENSEMLSHHFPSPPNTIWSRRLPPGTMG